jgi:hypothetical protein
MFKIVGKFPRSIKIFEELKNVWKYLILNKISQWAVVVGEATAFMNCLLDQKHSQGRVYGQFEQKLVKRTTSVEMELLAAIT